MNKLERVAVPKNSEMKSYYKFYLRDMTPVPAEKIALLGKGAGNPMDALKIGDRSKLLDSGYLSDEIGYYLLDDGSALLSNNTKFSGSTGDMLQWWFAWHCLDPLRYAIWDPFDHYHTEITEATRKKILDANISIPEKCFNVDHTVVESLVMGESGLKVMLHFRDPQEMGFDKSKLGTDALSFIVCANCEIITPEGQPNVPVVMVHTARNIEGGCELRSRFWMGCQIVDGEGICFLPPGEKFPESIVRQLLAHNFAEFTHLAAILPEVYRENNDTWL